MREITSESRSRRCSLHAETKTKIFHSSDVLPATYRTALQINSNLLWKQRARSKLARTSFPRPRRWYSTERISGFVVTKVSPCYLRRAIAIAAAKTIRRTNVGKKKAGVPSKYFRAIVKIRITATRFPRGERNAVLAAIFSNNRADTDSNDLPEGSQAKRNARNRGHRVYNTSRCHLHKPLLWNFDWTIREGEKETQTRL